jgi:hypothetical protein
VCSPDAYRDHVALSHWDSAATRQRQLAGRRGAASRLWWWWLCA